jgi:hypothetical protein
VLRRYLFVCQVLLKGFKNYSLDLTRRLLARAGQLAQAHRLPWLYLGSTRTSKEDLARQIAREDQVERGLVAVLRCVEPCQTYVLHGLQPVLQDAKWLHLYLYHQHPVLGFMHLRLQTWFPFQVEVCLNGREWRAQQLERAGLRAHGLRCQGAPQPSASDDPAWPDAGDGTVDRPPGQRRAVDKTGRVKSALE